jgi:hypothetical protein
MEPSQLLTLWTLVFGLVFNHAFFTSYSTCSWRIAPSLQMNRFSWLNKDKREHKAQPISEPELSDDKELITHVNLGRNKRSSKPGLLGKTEEEAGKQGDKPNSKFCETHRIVPRVLFSKERRPLASISVGQTLQGRIISFAK